MTHRAAQLVVVLTTAWLGGAQPARAVTFEYVHRLSTLDGFVPFSGARITYDDAARELFVYSEGRVRIFNESGMEIFSTGDTPEVGHVVSAAALENGDLLALSYRYGKPLLLRCNFRGELLRELALSGLPAELGDFRAHVLRHRAGRIYLADLARMRIVVADLEGRFEKAFDAAALLDVAEKREQVGLKGFNVDPAGNMLFTSQPLFRAYVLTLDGKLTAFGQRGSAAGKFNVVGGIAADERGYHYVTDLLKSSVLVFDADLKFVTEFGARGDDPGNLNSPVDVAAGNGMVFVSQLGRRGVSVFRLEGATGGPGGGTPGEGSSS
jgi:hypothetical protein